MISNHVNYFCCEDISLIENYEKAVNDQSQIWHCHHRLETDENKTHKQLKAEGKYYHRPASELIFLTRSEHLSLHNTGKCQSDETRQKISESKKGEKHPMYGRRCENSPIYGRRGENSAMYGYKHSEESRRHMSEAKKGENHPMYGKHHSEETKKKMSEAHKRKKAAT